MNKTIMFTGGGSAGHVTVNLALIPKFLQEGWTVEYIGSKEGIERQLVEPLEDVRYHAVSTGKLRRYMDWRNAADPFKVVRGAVEAWRIIGRRKPDVVFSKGGFVSVPVVLGAWLNRVPVVIHESDVTPGLANRIAIPFSTAVCTTFVETSAHLREGKAAHVGAVVRDGLLYGSAGRGRAFCGFDGSKPVLLIMGGSLGARAINTAVRGALSELTARFQIVHLCGKGQVDSSVRSPDYRQYEYIGDELADVLAMTDLVLSRAGANALFEFLALRKPMLLIPLTKAQSRGDQILNARSFRAAGYGDVLEEEGLTPSALVRSLDRLYANRAAYAQAMADSGSGEALPRLFELIKRTAQGARQS